MYVVIRHSAQEPEPGAAPIRTGAAPDCPMLISAFPASGGMIQFEAVSECRAGRVAVLHIEDLRIALRFDAAGEIAATIPGLARDHFLELVAEDGETARQPITLLDIGGVRRVALSWDDPIDLNLHAWEFGAAHGAEGHLWEGAETDERAYRRGVRGMVSSFPALDGQGASVEFYSFNPGRRSPVGRIALAVEYATRGRTPQAPYCDGGTLASPEYRVHGFDDGVMNDGVKRIFESVPCGTTLGDDDLYLRDLAQDILIVGR